MNVGQLIGEQRMRIEALEAQLAAAPAQRKIPVRKRPMRDRIVEYVGKAGRKVSMKEIAVDLNIGMAVAVMALLKLKREGILVREGARKHYRYGLPA